MSVVDTRRAPATRAATVRALAILEARRYARHPLFLTGSALMLVAMVLVTKDAAQGTGTATMTLVDVVYMPAFLLGLLGVLVGVQLARSTAKCYEPVQATPADGVARTAALCVAALVPGAAALVWLTWVHVVGAAWPIPRTALTAGDLASIRAAGVAYAVGGPLVGVMVGRWTRFRGAGLLAAVVLYGWVMLSNFGLSMQPSRFGTLIHLNAPFVSWLASDSTTDPPWIAAGSPWWYLAYISCLCALAAMAAMLHEAETLQRSRWLRGLIGITLLALVSLALAAASDPTRIPL